VGLNNKLKKSNLPQQKIVEGMVVEWFNEVESPYGSSKVSLIPWGFPDQWASPGRKLDQT
jgi:hypothetical protein